MIARIVSLEQAVNAMRRAVGSLEGRVAALSQQQWQVGGGGGGANPSAWPVMAPALTGGDGIPAMADGVAGSGVVTLYDIDPATGDVTALGDDTAWNWFPGSVGPGKHIYLCRFVNSKGLSLWVVPSEFCGAGS